jgi:hypothetical protein
MTLMGTQMYRPSFPHFRKANMIKMKLQSSIANQ